MRILIALLAAALPAFANVACSNAAGDAAALQAALTATGSFTVTGTCSIGGTTLQVPGNTSMTASGTATINYTGSGFAINLNGNTITISGFIINGGGFLTTPNSTSTPQTAVTLTNNTIQNITNGTDGLRSSGYWSNFVITGNHFNTISTVPYAQVTSATNAENCSSPVSCTSDNYPCSWSGGTNNCHGAGIINYMGMDHTTIESNSFNFTMDDAMHIVYNWGFSTGTTYHAMQNNSISYNTFINIHRMAFETQACNSPVGSCSFGLASNFTGEKIAGNYNRSNRSPYGNSYCYSLPNAATNPTIINNGCAATTGPMAYGYEIGQNGSLYFQGNTGTANSGSSLSTHIITGPSTSNPTYYNNYLAGATTNYFGTEPGCTGCWTQTYNYTATACDTSSACDTSNVAMGSSAVSPSGTTAVFSTYATSQIAVKNVGFLLDGALVATQEISTISTTFSTDRRWLYSNTYTGLSSGTHTVKAIATDVGGGTASTSQTFVVGGTSTPGTSFAPSMLSFGMITVSATSGNQTIVLTNNGSATLSITGMSLGGTNPGDFGLPTGTCGSTLAASASCNILVNFTPSATGARSAILLVVDNAAGSPQQINLMGTGSTSASGCTGSILTNCTFGTGVQSPWLFANGGATATLAVDATGACGLLSGHITASAPSAPGNNVELYQGGLTLPANGSVVNVSFDASTNRAQGINALGIQDGSPFTTYLSPGYTPSLAVGCFHYSTTRTVVNSPAPGSVRFTIQANNMQAGDRIDITNVNVSTSAPVSISAVDHVSHSSARLTLAIAQSINGAQSRSVISPAVCTGGTGGLVQQMELGMLTGLGPSMIMDVTGLTAGNAWNVCPEVSTDNGATWSSGVSTTITTLPLPSVHPAIPIAPRLFPANMPDMTGFVPDTTITTACLDSDFGTAYQNAVNRQLTQPTIIYLPVGANCHAPNYMFEAKPPDVQNWAPSSVDTTADTIALGGTPTLTVGQQVVFSLQYASGSAFPASTSCEFGNGLVPGVPVFIASVTGSNVVTLACNNNGQPGALMNFTDQGTAARTNFYWALYPRNLKYIQFRSAAPDSQLPPDGVLLTPAWRSKLATFQDPLVNLGPGAGHSFMTMGDTDANLQNMPANIYFGPGLEITTVDAPESHTSSDPVPWYNLIITQPDNSGIIFARDYIHLLGTPSRGSNLFQWDGSNNGFVNNWVENWTWFHSMYSGLVVTATSSTAASMTSGTHNVGSGPISVAARTITFSGTGSGTIYMGLDMQNSNTFTVWMPAGETASCSPSCATSNTQYTTGDGSCTNHGNWERDGSGQVSVGVIACVVLTSGSLGTVTAANSFASTLSPEGCGCMIGGRGPGPYTAIGNHLEGAGLMWHHDDSGGTTYIRGDYTYLRNYFLSPMKYLYGAPQSDGLRYFQRQPLEWKGGRRNNFNGNIVDGNWNEDTGASVMVALTSVDGEGITDVDFRNNTFMHGPGVTNTAGLTASGGTSPQLTPPGLRFRFCNNLAWDMGSSTYWVPSGGFTAPNGWVLEGPNQQEDLIVCNNTVVGNSGRTPTIMWNFDSNTEGIDVENNIQYIDSTYQGLSTDGDGAPSTCHSLIGKASADCWFTPTYVWKNNLMIGNGQAPSAVSAAWPSLPNYFQTGSSSLSTVGWINYKAATPPMNGNSQILLYGLTATSPWQAGAPGINDHGKPVGVNIDELEVAQGKVSLQSAQPVTTSGFTVNYQAADSASCRVLYSTTNDVTSIPTSNGTAGGYVDDGGGARQRNVAVAGLSGQTVYYYFVLCPGNETSQKSGSVKTH